MIQCRTHSTFNRDNVCTIWCTHRLTQSFLCIIKKMWVWRNEHRRCHIIVLRAKHNFEYIECLLSRNKRKVQFAIHNWWRRRWRHSAKFQFYACKRSKKQTAAAGRKEKNEREDWMEIDLFLVEHMAHSGIMWLVKPNWWSSRLQAMNHRNENTEIHFNKLSNICSVIEAACLHELHHNF